MPDLEQSVPKVASGDTAQTLVGGARVCIGTLKEALRRAPRLIAVDGGANTVLAAGMVPDAVVGDFDSLSKAARTAFADRLHHIAEQDSTDFAKALRTFPAPMTLAVGFMGARHDHFLACLTELARSGAPCVLLGEEECLCIAPAALALDLAAGTRVSLWPLGPASGRSEGLRWPLDGLDFGPVTRVATSNAATGSVRLALEGGPWVLSLPAEVLPALLGALENAPRGAAGSPL